MGPFAIKRYGTAFNTIGSWVEDTAQFIKKDNGEWFLRGGNSSNGTQAGLFSFRPHNGALYQWNDITFRIVLTPIDK